MLRFLTLVSLLLLTLSQSPVRASPCLSFDVNFNLIAFGFQGKDWNAGTQETWATATTATDITTTGRPPFDGKNTTCYLAQFFNAIYVLNGDAKSPNSIHIYDVTAKSWSTQSTTPGQFDYSSFETILDHDTNVFYAVSGSNLFSLDMASMKAATSNPISWNLVQKTSFDSSYKPVMALAQNHIHFLDVLGADAGEAFIFVIHYSYFQPDPQAYPNDGGATFPKTHGKTASIFMDTGVQQEFAFMPDDFSGTYVINVETNTTQALPAPPVKDTQSSYVAGITSIVQLDSAGGVHFFSYTPGNPSANAASKWDTVKALVSVATPATPQPSGSSTSSNPKATNTGISGNTDASDTGGAVSDHAVTSGLVGLAVLFAILGFI